MFRSFAKLVNSVAPRVGVPNVTFCKNMATAAAADASKNVYNEAAVLTNYDVDLALRLKFSDKVRRAKPTTPGKRHLITLDRSELFHGPPVRELTVYQKRTGGRNNQGRMTARGRGGGSRHRYRIVDFRRAVLDVPGTVQRLERDPNRTAHIALISYPDNRMQYIVAPHGLAPGDTILATRSREIDIKVGNAMCLRHIPIGSTICCIESKIGGGATFARAAGSSATLIEKENTGRPNYALVRISSKEVRLIHLDCMAVIGSVSNPLYHVQSLGKAGRSRWAGRRPFSRGVARNPVDHPHGGGGAAGRPGRPSCSPTGQLAKGFKTRRVRRPSQFIVLPRGGGQLNLSTSS